MRPAETSSATAAGCSSRARDLDRDPAGADEIGRHDECPADDERAERRRCDPTHPPRNAAAVVADRRAGIDREMRELADREQRRPDDRGTRVERGVVERQNDGVGRPEPEESRRDRLTATEHEADDERGDREAGHAADGPGDLRARDRRQPHGERYRNRGSSSSERYRRDRRALRRYALTPSSPASRDCSSDHLATPTPARSNRARNSARRKSQSL